MMRFQYSITVPVLAVFVVIGAALIPSMAFQPPAALLHRHHHHQPQLPSLTRATTKTSTTQLQYTNTPSSSSSSQYSSSDHERFRQAIAAAAAAKSMYYQNEMSIQELDQVRAAFESLLQRHHLDYSSTTQPHMGLEVYYPEGVIHPTTTTTASSTMTTTSYPSHPLKHTTEETQNIEDEENDDDDSNHHLLLTTSGRRLRELEIQLLESLRTNDDGIDQLVHLWTTERNAEASYALLQMQNSNQICSHGLVQEETDLANLCRHYPGWPEPWSRLATLLFYKGVARWSDALSAAEEAIRIKPWHFEALNVCTLVLTQMDHPDNPDVIFGDDESVADLRRRCHRLSRLALPKLIDPNTNTAAMMNPNTSTGSYSSYSSFSPKKDALEARHMWVSRAVATAQHQLQCAEQYTAAFRHKQHHQQRMSSAQPVNVMVSDHQNHDPNILSAWQ